MCKIIDLKNIFKTFYSSFLKKFACAQKVGFPRSGYVCVCMVRMHGSPELLSCWVVIMLPKNLSGVSPVTDLGACPGAGSGEILVDWLLMWSSLISTVSLLAVSKLLSLNPLYRVNGTWEGDACLLVKRLCCSVLFFVQDSCQLDFTVSTNWNWFYKLSGSKQYVTGHRSF